jgi:hypothetical protein
MGYQPDVGVDCAPIASSQPDLHPAETMRGDRDLFARAYDLGDTVLSALN